MKGSEAASPLTALLIRWRAGESEAFEELTSLVYESLRSLAARHLAYGPSSLSLCPTEIVHEVYGQLLQAPHLAFEDRIQFLAFVSRQMRQVLVQHARSFGPSVDGSHPWQRVTMTDLSETSCGELVDLITINAVLERLEAIDFRKARLVDLIVFGGLTQREVAELLAQPEQAVRREWRFTRAWLQHELKDFCP
jgi:RNA polymerase sigma-70 factor, ECF subfamily